jgi:hypothetical protein
MPVVLDYAQEKSTWDFEENKNGITVTRYKGNETHVVIPNAINGKPVTAISRCNSTNGGIFREVSQNVTSVIIPSTVVEIGDWSFFPGVRSDKGILTSVTIPNGVIRIGRSAFEETALRSVTIPSTVQSIGGNAFPSTTTEITLPGNIEIDEDSFDKGNGFVKYYLYGGKTAGHYIMNKRQTNEWDYIVWSNGNDSRAIITSYKGRTTEIIVPPVINNIQVVGIAASEWWWVNSTGIFGWGEKTTICAISEGIAFIDSGAFANNSTLAILRIPDSVRSIGEHAFIHLDNIYTISIGNNVDIIAFEDTDYDGQYNEFSAHDFANFYNKNGKRKGVYTYSNEKWTWTQ